jgi:hypothetical protein
MNMTRRYREPTIEDILSDSIVKAMMRADGVDPHRLRTMLSRVGARSIRDDDGWIPWPPDTSGR